MPADLHTHNYLCKHADGKPIEYAKAAQDLGLSAIGFSDHNPMPEPFDDWRMDIADLPKYLEMAEEARTAVEPFPVRLGLECDFLIGGEQWIEELSGKASWDYLIGSVHYLAEGWDFDNPKHLSRIDEYGIEEAWTLYWKLAEQCILSGLFDIFAHPDLIKKFGHRPKGELTHFYEPVIAALAEKEMAYEINTAGMRKPAAEFYPSYQFIEMAFAADVPVIISSDAHSPKEVGWGFRDAAKILHEIGYTHTATFHQRRRGSEPLTASGFM